MGRLHKFLPGLKSEKIVPILQFVKFWGYIRILWELCPLVTFESELDLSFFVH